MNSYGDIFMRMQYETATVVFFKKTGELRVMLCTRNLKTAELLHGNIGGLLNGHDNRCNIRNGNISVIDMLIGEPRSFNVGRLSYINFYGSIDTIEKYEEVYKAHKDIEVMYKSTIDAASEVNMDNL